MSKISSIIVFLGLFLVAGLANEQASDTQLLVALALAIVIGIYSLISSYGYRTKQINKDQQ